MCTRSAGRNAAVVVRHPQLATAPYANRLRHANRTDWRGAGGKWGWRGKAAYKIWLGRLQDLVVETSD